MSKLEYGTNEVSNKDYHADTKFLSSSSLKLLLDDPAKFYKEKILGEREHVSKPAFDEGSLVHALILEPHVIDMEFAFFDGMRKQGKEWEAFKLLHQGKTMLSKPQRARCEYYVEAYKRLPAAVELIKGGLPEHTICHKYGDLDLKVRCDYINIDKGYIVDVKTSGFPVDKDSFSMTVDQFKYQLSAVMYCKLAELEYGKPFDFYFIAISKKEQDCQVFKVSKETYMRGSLLMAEAIKTYKRCIDTGEWIKKEKAAPNVDDYEILEI